MQDQMSAALFTVSLPAEMAPTSDPTTEDSKYLKAADLSVICLLTFVPAACTIIYSIYQCFYPIPNRNERSMDVLPVSLSLIASYLSANTIIGLPATITRQGLTFGWIIFTFPICMFLVSYFFVPVIYNLKVVDIFVYLELRFSQGMQRIGAFMFCCLQLIYLSIVLRGPGIIFEKLSGFPETISIVIVGIVCSFYTALGGMKAGIYIEAFQSMTMFIGLLAVVISTYSNNSTDLISRAERNLNGSLFLNTANNSNYSIQSVLIGATVLYTAIYAVNQSQVQRYAACKTMKKAKISLWLNSPGLIIIIILCCLFGLQVLAFNVQDKDMDKAVGKFLMSKIQTEGIVGLFVAGIFSATMSSFSCGLSATNKVLLQNLVPKFNFSQKKSEVIRSIIAFVIGCICTGISRVIPPGILKASFFIYGSLCCPICGVVILGLFFPWTNKKAVYLALGITLPLIIIFYIVEQKVEHAPAINILWYGPISITMIITISILGSKLMGFQDPTAIPRYLLSPLIVKVLEKSPEYKRSISMQEQAKMVMDGENTESTA